MSEQWFSERQTDEIAIEDLEIECIVGIYENERTTPQRVVADVRMAVDIERAALEDSLAATVDYEWVCCQVAFILRMGRFQLLETAAQAIVRALLLSPVEGETRGAITAVDLTLRKPAALRGRGVPQVRVQRTAASIVRHTESKSFGTVDVIHETADVGVYRLNVFPRRGIETHVHRRMDEAEMVLSSGLECQGQLAARASVRKWPHGVPHRYDNPTDSVQSLLCIDRPKFIDEDEVIVDSPVGNDRAQSVWDS